MIKHINPQNVTTTPFRANKARELFNVQNEDCVILEPLSASVSTPDTLIALDYVDYSSGSPLLNSECNIALEQQTEDQAIFEEGISGSLRPYNPDKDEPNTTGTSKMLLYNQMRLAFYNDYQNPTEILGMENIDFQLSKTNRFLADDFRMFTIPRFIMGDKIQPGTVQFTDTTFDDNVTIQDDANGNLIAGVNLFSKIQEVRTFGNSIYPGTSSFTCSVFYDGPPIFIPVFNVSLLNWPPPTASADSALDSMDEYFLGQSTNFDGGLGIWLGPWFVNPTTRLVASESYEEYPIGQGIGTPFTGGFGWVTPWSIYTGSILLAATESFNEYLLNQTSSFNGGFGWNAKWTSSSGSI